MIDISSIALERVDATLLAEEAQCQLHQSRYMAKFASAVLIVASNGDVFVAAHEGRDGEFAQGALGSLMETYRYTPFDEEASTECPLDVFRRGLIEELDLLQITPEKFNKTGFYFDRAQPVAFDEWSAGPLGGYQDYYGLVTSMIVRVENPDELICKARVSEELLWTDFWPVEAILKSKEPKRPGFDDWLRKMQRRLSIPLPCVGHTPVVWRDGPITGKDVKFPFSP